MLSTPEMWGRKNLLREEAKNKTKRYVTRSRGMNVKEPNARALG